MELIVDPRWASQHPHEAARLQIERVLVRAREQRLREVEEASRLTGLSMSCIRRLAREGRVDAAKRLIPKGSRRVWAWMVDVQDLLAYTQMPLCDKIRAARGER